MGWCDRTGTAQIRPSAEAQLAVVAVAPLPDRGASPSRRMTMVGSLRGVPVVDEDSCPVEQAGLEVLQRLLGS
jgi:hypothetical protein